MKKLQFIVGLISCVLSIYSSATLADEATTPKTTSLKVALYPYVPRLEQFKASIDRNTVSSH